MSALYPIPITRENAIAFFARIYRGTHRIPSDLRDDGGGCWSVSAYVGRLGLSTFDDDVLTRLVLLAHQRSYRTWITSSQPHNVRINIAARSRTSQGMAYFHPSIGEAIDKFNARDEVPWPRELVDSIIADVQVVECCRHCGARWICPDCGGTAAGAAEKAARSTCRGDD